MDLYNLYTYKAGSINVPKFINEELSKQYENQTFKYLIFSQEDIIFLANDSKTLCKEYSKFIETWNLPMAMYHYYGRFNSVLPESANKPNPKVILTCKKGSCGVINQLAYGFLIIDVEKFKSKNLKFDESYPEIFYLQDMAEKLMKEDLWISNCWFIDIPKSWELFKEHKNNGYNIDMKKFAEEKDRYNKNPHEYKPIQVFLDKFKTLINGPVEQTTPTSGAIQQPSDGLIDINSFVEEKK